MPGAITCAGLGDAVGICIPGVITCPGLGDGDSVGICMPGVITCAGLGDGDGLGLVVRVVGVRLARVDVLFFLGARFGLGLAAGFIFDMSCCSCCGKTLTLTANISTSATSILSAILKLLGRFMVSPYVVRQSEHRFF
ncbi:MAG: hypothetical protein ACREA9_09965 [Pyrinomonadaceae bacterium]